MITKCPNQACNSLGSFRLKEGAPTGSNYKVWFVQCAICGTAINAMEYHNTGAGIQRLEKQLSDIERRISNIELYLDSILRKMK